MHVASGPSSKSQSKHLDKKTDAEREFRTDCLHETFRVAEPRWRLVLAWSWHRLRWEAEQISCMGDGTHLGLPSSREAPRPGPIVD